MEFASILLVSNAIYHIEQCKQTHEKKDGRLTLCSLTAIIRDMIDNRWERSMSNLICFNDIAAEDILISFIPQIKRITPDGKIILGLVAPAANKENVSDKLYKGNRIIPFKSALAT